MYTSIQYTIDVWYYMMAQMYTVHVQTAEYALFVVRHQKATKNEIVCICLMFHGMARYQTNSQQTVGGGAIKRAVTADRKHWEYKQVVFLIWQVNVLQPRKSLVKFFVRCIYLDLLDIFRKKILF